MPGDYVPIRTYVFPMEAELAKVQLEEEGIPARLVDNQVASLGYIAASIGYTKLAVPGDLAQRADAILKESEKLAAERRAAEGEHDWGEEGEDDERDPDDLSRRSDREMLERLNGSDPTQRGNPWSSDFVGNSRTRTADPAKTGNGASAVATPEVDPDEVADSGTPLPPDDDESVEDRPTSPREQAADRALRVAIISCLLWPLLPIAAGHLAEAWFHGTGPLHEPHLSRSRVAAALILVFGVPAAMVFVAFLFRLLG
jgi:hypothetical protein